MLLGMAPVVAFAAENKVSSLTNGHSQTHTVGSSIADMQSKNASYALKVFNQCAVPLDGSNGNPDLCIPGLSESDNMIPQGMTWYKYKDWALIAAYDADDKDCSVIYAIEIETGKFVAQFNIKNADGTDNINHVGGIAASDYNLYLTDKTSSNSNVISYIPLSEFDVAEGTVKDVTIQGSVVLSELGLGDGKAETSYCTIDNNVLWVGNFYRDGSDYDDPANSTYNSMCFGYYLQGAGSTTEWSALNGSVAGSATTENCFGYPSYTIAIPNSIENVQCVLVVNGRIYINSSWGRTAETSDFFVADIDLEATAPVSVTLGNGTTVNAYDMAGYQTYVNLPMSEGMFERNNEIYLISETAANKYINGTDSLGLNKAKAPTDVVWRLDPYALVGEASPEETNAEVYYKKVYNLDQISINDEYLIVFQSTAVEQESGNHYLYALDARGGYKGTALPQYVDEKQAEKEYTGDSLGIIGKEITDYEFQNGNDRLVLKDSTYDTNSIRWRIERTDSGTGVKISTYDDYFAKAPYLYYGSRLLMMAAGKTERFDYLNLSCEDDANGFFSLWYKNTGTLGGAFSSTYWMFCNDGTYEGGLDNYTATYATLSNKWSYETVYKGATEVAGTFHMDGSAKQSGDDTGNKMGGDNSSADLSDVKSQYGYFSIYKRVVKETTTSGKSNIFTDKKAYPSADGTYSIDLQAYATGATQSAETTIPLDIIMVMDSSSSMSDKDCTTYTKGTRLTYEGASSDVYYKYGDEYYKIYQEEDPKDGRWDESLDLNYNNLTAADAMYYKHSDGEQYQIYRGTVKTRTSTKIIGVSWYTFSTRFFLYFKANDGYIWVLYTGDDCCINGQTSHPAHFSGVTDVSQLSWESFDDTTSGIYYCSRKSSGNATTNSSKNNWPTESEDSIYNGTVYLDKTRTFYHLYIEINGVKYYLQDKSVVPVDEKTTVYYSTKDILWQGDYYTKDTSATRRAATVKSMNELVDNLRTDADKNEIEHRIAFVTFGNDASSAKPIVSVTDNDYKYTGVWQESDTSTGDGSIVKYNDDGITSAYETALCSVNGKTVDKAISTISGMNDSYVCAAPNHGLEMAYNILAKSDATEDYKNGTRQAVVLFITDGLPGNPDRGVDVCKVYGNAAIIQASKIETLGYVDIYSIYLGSESKEGFSVDDYMNGVSSNYPEATGYPDYSFTDDNGNNVVGSLGTKAADDFYTNLTSGAELSEVFDDISYKAIASGTAVSLSSKAVLKDVLSDHFTFPEGSENLKVTLKTQDLSYDMNNKLVEGAITEAPAGVTYTLANNNEINVTGFDYSTYYVAPGHAGKRLIVNIEGVLPVGEISGYGINTNDNERSGIYAREDDEVPAESLAKEDITKLLPAPETDIPTYNYVFDYSSEMPITAISNELLAVAETPQKLDTSNYQTAATNALGGTAELKSGTLVNLTTAAQDSYLYCFMKTNEEGVYQWAKVNLIPASNVYFEETSLTKGNSWTSVGTASAATQEVSNNATDVYGYDASYNNETDTFSGGAAYKAVLDESNRMSDSVIFTFTGESFNLISACGPKTGVLAVKITNSDGTRKKAYVVDTYYSDTNYLSADGLMHNVPVVNFSGIYDTYTVEIIGSYMTNAGAVKNAVSTAAISDNESLSVLDEMLIEAGLDEFVGLDVEYLWMDENSVLNGGTGADEYGVALMSDEISTQSTGVSVEAYIDAVRIYKPYGETDPDQYSSSERNAKYINVLNALKNGGGSSSTVGGEDAKSVYYFEQSDTGDNVFSFDDYEGSLFGGPQNEIYLKSGQGITFSLNDYDPEKSAVMIALRRIKKSGSTASSLKCTVNTSEIDVVSTNEIYYNLSAVVGGSTVGGSSDESAKAISIKNNSKDDEILAISYIKLVDATMVMAADLNPEVAVQSAMKSKSVSFDPFAVYTYTGTGNEDESFNDNNLPSIIDLSLFNEIIAMLEKVLKLIFGISTIIG